MSLLANLKSDDTIAGERDSVGGSVLDSGIYKAKVVLAYLIKATSGAVGLVLNLKTDAGREIRQTIYMTSGTAKGGTNFYTNKDGEKQYLPGFLVANSLALLTIGKEISDLSTDVKVVNAYSKEAKAEVPTKVDMLTDLLGQEILVGLIKQTVDKNQKNDAGEYIATGETRDENEIDKLFRARDRMTVAEIRAQATEATFAATWENKFTGTVKMKAKGAAAGNGVAGAPKGAAAAKPKQSLFA
jgi:hypothetical protein